MGLLEWLEPIQAYSGTKKQAFNRANIPNTHALVIKNDVPFHEIKASHSKVVEAIERRKKALRTANVIDKHDPAMRQKSGVSDQREVCPGNISFPTTQPTWPKQPKIFSPACQSDGSESD